MEKKKRLGRTGQTGQNIMMFEGVQYISTAHALKIYGLSRSAFSKKLQKSGIAGRRLDNTNTHYFTMDEADQIAHTANYRSTPPRTMGDHLTTIHNELLRISDRLATMTNSTQDYIFSSKLAQIVGTVERAQTQTKEALNLCGLTEPKRVYKKRGRPRTKRPEPTPSNEKK